MKKLLLVSAAVLATQISFSTTFTVNSLGAGNTGAANSGTLRYCMGLATITPGGPHTINFSVAGTIAIGSNANVLPNITSTGLTIDGTTAPGYAGLPVITIDGTGTTSGNGFSIGTTAVTIKGIDITFAAAAGISITGSGSAFNIDGCIIRNSGYYGIQVNGASNGYIQNSKIGVDATGSTCEMNQYDGIDIQGGGSNQILNNHIACNGYNGIQLGNATNGNTVKGNIIGPLMGTCTFNGYRGIDIEEGSTNNIIGGITPSEANKIAGNDYWGIEVKDAGSTGNIISGNSMSCNAYDAIDVNTGGNNNIIPPVITVANGTTVSGTSTANAVIEVFRSQQASAFGCAGTPNTQGADFMGTTTANGSGAWSLSGTFDGFVTATQRTVADGSSKYCTPVNTGIAASVSNGCAGAVVGAGSAPAANFSMSTDTVCVGDCIDFTDLSANGPTSWSWTLTGGTPSSSTAQDPTACYNVAGNYTVQLAATNANGTGNSTKNIVVLPLPLITVSQNGTLLAATTGHPTYQWYMNGNMIPGANGDTLIISVNGNYTCAVTGSNGCSDTSAVFTVTNMGIENSVLSQIHLYPNPANEELILDLGTAAAEFTSAEIIDVTGKQIQTVPLHQSIVRLEITALPGGMYLLQLKGNTAHTLRFTKL